MELQPNKIYYDKKRKIKFYLYAKSTCLYGYCWNEEDTLVQAYIAPTTPGRFEPAKPDIYAVDFDGTLCKNKYPDIGNPNYHLINNLKELKQFGNKLILWTCREGDYLKKAIDWCAQHGLSFDAVNDNLPELTEKFNNNCRKIFADYYIDDRAIKVKCEE